MTDLDRVLVHIDQNLASGVEKLIALISIPSISNDPEWAARVEEAANWLEKDLSGMGLDAKIVQTEGLPVVLAHSREGMHDDGPALLFYGHYDVQPVGNHCDWKHPPFEPTIVEENRLRRIYGRGASDSKSQMWTFIEALRSWLAVRKKFPGKITILLEGEEEFGSASLPAFIKQHRSELGCDVAFICDFDMWSPTQPAVTTQLKGLVHEKVTVFAPNPDLHSGYFGAIAANPIRILSNILSRMHDNKGRVAIDGFYDGVSDIPDGLRQQWRTLSDDAYMLKSADLRGGVIEEGYTPLEAVWGRPTLDMNGLTSGNQGPGERSVLPGAATARLTFRLVDGQDPERIRENFRNFVRARLPDGCSVEFEGANGSRALVMSQDNSFVHAVSRGLQSEWDVPTVLKGSGGSVPLAEMFSDVLGVDCIVIGFILADDAIHAPDERYDIERFHKGMRSWVRILGEIETMQR